MSKQRITNATVNQIINTPKATITRMSWFSEKSGCGERYKYYSACEVMKTTIEDLFFRSEYKAAIIFPDTGETKVHEKINAGLFYKNHQISAIHYCQTPHKNKVGKGLPHYRELITGLHRHIWIDDVAGSGYAEPIKEIGTNEITLHKILDMFCQENNLTIRGGIKQPNIARQYDIEDIYTLG